MLVVIVELKGLGVGVFWFTRGIRIWAWILFPGMGFYGIRT